MVTVAKMTDGKIVEIVRFVESVGFSADKDWVMVCFDFEKMDRRREQFKWVPATTRFTWVREYEFA